MYQASVSKRRGSSPRSSLTNVWSHNTGYIGAAGIHSEVGNGALTRNQLMQRRSSNAITTEQEIFNKEMKSMQANRKSLESSMLQYSQKMKDISNRRTRLRKSPIAFQTTNTKHMSGGQAKLCPLKANVTATSLSILNKQHVKNDVDENIDSYYSNSSDNISISSRKKLESRLSLDSGISVNSHRESCASEPSTTRSAENETLHSRTAAEVSSGKDQEKEIAHHKERGRPRMRFRDSKTSKLVPVADEDFKDNTLLEQENEEEEEFETPRIQPFPDELLYNDRSISPTVLKSIMECEEELLELYENQVLDPLSAGKPGKGAFRVSKRKKRSPYVFFRPKLTQSPSLAALRLRFFRRFGPNSIYFRYSEEVLAALRSLSNSPNRQQSDKSSSYRSLSPMGKQSRSLSPSKRSEKSGSSCSSPTLFNIDLEEILQSYSVRLGGIERLFLDETEVDEFFVTKDTPKLPKLSIDRTASAASSKATQRTLDRSFVSRLEEVKENDDSLLKPVLKKEELQYANEKKNVQFFLPDIFMQANACISQPP